MGRIHFALIRREVNFAMTWNVEWIQESMIGIARQLRREVAAAAAPVEPAEHPRAQRRRPRRRDRRLQRRRPRGERLLHTATGLPSPSVCFQWYFCKKKNGMTLIQSNSKHSRQKRTASFPVHVCVDGRSWRLETKSLISGGFLFSEECTAPTRVIPGRSELGTIGRRRRSGR